MKTKIVLEKVNTDIMSTASRTLCAGEIQGARIYHHILTVGESLQLCDSLSYYRIVMLISGTAEFVTAGESYVFSERVTIIPALDKTLDMIAREKVDILEIQWDTLPEDAALSQSYSVRFPYVQQYRLCIQYSEETKSEKTISRMTIPQRVIPRLACGSVETYGEDIVQPHKHPMLDQLFFSFPENNMEVLIDGEHVPMAGNEIIHIPLGSAHGVYVPEGAHCHYLWFDFILDNEEGLEELDSSQQVTGDIRSF